MTKSENTTDTLARPALTAIARPFEIAPTCLLWCVPPINGESLIGWIARAAEDSVFDQTLVITKAANIPSHHARNVALQTNVNEALLAEILRTSAAEIKRRRHLPLPEDPLNRIDFYGATIPKYDLKYRTRQMIKTVTEHTPYHQDIAAHALIPFCPLTGEFWYDTCKNCFAINAKGCIPFA